MADRRIVIDRRPLTIILIGKLRRQLWLALLLLLFGLAVSSDPPSDLPIEAWRTVCIFLLCAILWASSLLPVAITSLLAIALLPLLDVMPATEAYSAFGSRVVFFILGAFMLSAAVITSGLSRRIATQVVIRFGQTPRRLVLAVFFLTAAGSTVMSSHAVGAMVFPIVLDIAHALKLRPLQSRLGMALFFALAWGCIIGGSLTILGGGRAPLAIGIGLQNAPEGLAVAVSLLGEGYTKFRAWVIAALTGLVEPIGGLLGAGIITLSQPLLPWGLAFAAGAMLCTRPVSSMPPKASISSVARWPTAMFAVCVSLKLATTHKSSGTMYMSWVPALTSWPTRALTSLRRPARGARISVRESSNSASPFVASAPATCASSAPRPTVTERTFSAAMARCACACLTPA